MDSYINRPELPTAPIDLRRTQFDPQICVLTFKHVHSGTAPVDPTFTHATFSNLGDPRYDGRVITTPARRSACRSTRTTSWSRRCST